MITIGELIKELELSDGGFIDRAAEITDICYDSRKAIGKGTMFICIKGAVSDGHDFAYNASCAGATAIVAEHPVEVAEGTQLIITRDTRKALSLISAAWFGHPAKKLTTIGITGTKGKSTTTYMIRDILKEAGNKVGIIGTIGVTIGDESFATGNTTPESYLIQEYFAKMVDAGCNAVVMEVSSQGLKQSRVWGIEFDYALFTNLESDHIGTNEHASFEEYMYCKSLLFEQCKVAIANADDKHMKDVVKSSRCKLITYGINNDADLKATDIRLIGEGGHMGIAYGTKGISNGEFELPIPGKFNVYNSLAAITTALNFTGDVNVINSALLKVSVKGRLEPVRISDSFSLIIDYAHNAMALESLLVTLKEYKPERLVCLFGCGGNRSKERRFEMGEVSSKLADLTVVTSDNPRFEEPMDIINDIMVGVKKANGEYVMIPDRREAIKYVIENARKGDVIVLAGKGNEDYQEIKGVKYHMDEREIVAEVAALGNYLK